MPKDIIGMVMGGQAPTHTQPDNFFSYPFPPDTRITGIRRDKYGIKYPSLFLLVQTNTKSHFACVFFF